MAILSVGDVGPEVMDLQDLLSGCGWRSVVGASDGFYGPRTELAVWRFQEAWAFDELAVDGVYGPQTALALGICLVKQGRVSENFWPHEFASADNGEVRVLRGLLVALERLRAVRGVPLFVVSGFRSSAHNAAVGGAVRSQHLYGAAVDLRPEHELEEVIDLRVFSGIGYEASSGRVRHVDVRHLSDVNTTFGSPAVPTVWPYG